MAQNKTTAPAVLVNCAVDMDDDTVLLIEFPSSGEELVLAGRAPANTRESESSVIIIPNAQLASPHCRIKWDAAAGRGALTPAEDEAATCVVNGRLATETIFIHPGDRIGLGLTLFRVVARRQHAAAAAARVGVSEAAIMDPWAGAVGEVLAYRGDLVPKGVADNLREQLAVCEDALARRCAGPLLIWCNAPMKVKQVCWALDLASDLKFGVNGDVRGHGLEISRGRLFWNAHVERFVLETARGSVKLGHGCRFSMSQCEFVFSHPTKSNSSSWSSAGLAIELFLSDLRPLQHSVHHLQFITRSLLQTLPPTSDRHILLAIQEMTSDRVLTDEGVEVLRSQLDKCIAVIQLYLHARGQVLGGAHESTAKKPSPRKIPESPRESLLLDNNRLIQMKGSLLRPTRDCALLFEKAVAEAERMAPEVLISKVNSDIKSIGRSAPTHPRSRLLSTIVQFDICRSKGLCTTSMIHAMQAVISGVEIAAESIRVSSRSATPRPRRAMSPIVSSSRSRTPPVPATRSFR